MTIPEEQFPFLGYLLYKVRHGLQQATTIRRSNYVSLHRGDSEA